MEENLLRSPEIQAKIQARAERRDLIKQDPRLLYPWLMRRCKVRVLLVADGLDFSETGFGLSTFVETLINAGLWHAYFEITLAHLDSYVSDDQVMVGKPGIHRSIKGFVFDNPVHFTPDMYDVVYLFGISTDLSWFAPRAGNPTQYPSDRLGDAELVNLSLFQDNGGGLFATGDHGQLGAAMCAHVKRARNMRIWYDTSFDNALNEVSMDGERRNDTNHIGHDTVTQFNDQSDDIPQTIYPKLYKLGIGPFYRYSYPHPILCGPNGVIRVLPDHPHEGEVIVPSDLTLNYPYDSTVEYPFATGSTTYRISPEIIARSLVPAGNTAGSKDPTKMHTFGAIGAYDGHSAGVGRVVTDATWHHYVNINLIGEEWLPPSDPKSLGFLASASGLAHLENIKHYYKNTALWLARPALQNCFRKRLLWKLLRYDRVIEAVASSPDINMEKLSDRSFILEVGLHAEAELKRLLPPCSSRRFILDIIKDAAPEMASLLNPWDENPDRVRILELNFINPEPLLPYALGGALLAFNQDKPVLSPGISDTLELEGEEAYLRGAYTALQWALDSFTNDLSAFSAYVQKANDDVKTKL
jgi:hypothetical protein